MGEIPQKFLRVGDISVYREAFELSNIIWSVVLGWDYLAKNTLGQQLIRAVDSVSANIAEGFGRYHKRDKIKFYYNARGSVIEAQDWLEKAKARMLINAEDYENIRLRLEKLPRGINWLIKITAEKLDI